MVYPLRRAIFASALVTAFGGVSAVQAEAMRKADADRVALDVVQTQGKAEAQ